MRGFKVVDSGLGVESEECYYVEVVDEAMCHYCRLILSDEGDYCVKQFADLPSAQSVPDTCFNLLESYL